MNGNFKNLIIAGLLGALIAIGGWGLFRVSNLAKTYASINYVDKQMERVECSVNDRLTENLNVINKRFDKLDNQIEKLNDMLVDHIIHDIPIDEE